MREMIDIALKLTIVWRLVMGCGTGFHIGVGGRNVIDFVCERDNCEFKQAILKLMYELNIDTSNYKTVIPKSDVKPYEKTPQEKQIILPPKNNESKRVFAYLNSRYIDKEIINYCLNNNLIYEDAEHHNTIFLGYDENNKVKFGCARATNPSRVMYDLKGSSKEYSFRLLSKEKSTTVHIFESAIDLLSFATLIKNRGMNFKNFNFISLSGVYQTANEIEESKVPVVLKKYLEINKNIRTIILHLDNDIAGRNATKALEFLLKKDYEVLDRPSSYGKDVNDYLVHQMEEKK